MANETVLAELVARIKADTSQLDRALNDLPNKAKQSTDKMGAAFGTLTRAAGAFGVALSVGAVVGFGKQLFAAADEMQNLAMQTDFAVSSLVTLEPLLVKNGSNLQQLSAASSILQSNIGAAAAGSEELIKKFEALGLSVTKLRQLGPEEAFYAITQALFELDDASQRADLGRDLLGRGFRQLIPTLKETNGELRTFIDRANEAGGEEVAEAIKKLDEWGDSFEEFGIKVRNNAIVALVDFVEWTKKAATMSVPGAGQGVAVPEGVPADKRQDYINWLKTSQARGAITSFTPSPEVSTANPARGGNADVKRATSATKELTQAQRDAARIVEITRTAQEKYDIEMAKATKLVDEYAKTNGKAGISMETFNRYQQQMQEEMQKSVEKTEVLATVVKDYLGDAFESAVFDAENAGDAISSILDGIARKIARVAFIDPLADAASGFISSAFKDFSFGSFFGGARAAGGPVSSGKSYLVGEQGPEIFTPSASGMITPNNKLGGSSITITQVFQISPGVPELIDAKIRQAAPVIASSAQSGVFQAIQQGGPAARLIGARA